jgi:argininosuccinate synthase
MRIVVAYSGSLEGSAAIQWLRERHDAEIVAVTVDLGQGRELEAVRDRALTIGAQRAHVLDARDLFAQAYILPALRADALHDGRVPMALALSRPLIAQKLVEIAGIERATAVAHTGHAAGGTSRLDLLLGAMAPALPVLTPAREWALSAEALASFARAHGLAAPGDEATRVEAISGGARSGGTMAIRRRTRPRPDPTPIRASRHSSMSPSRAACRRRSTACRCRSSNSCPAWAS